MDTNFQTSFIPKKPLSVESTVEVPHTSLFTFIATLIFFGALAIAAIMYFYEANLNKNIATDKTSLVAARNAFEPTLLTQLQKLDRRLIDANKLLNNHVAVSPIFATLQDTTLKSIQFTKFSYGMPTDANGQIIVRINGKARDYSSIALQSDEFAKNKNIHNPIFSNLTLDDKTGIVGFDLVFTVDPDLVHFTNHVDSLISEQGILQATQPATTDSQNPTTATGQTTTGAKIPPSTDTTSPMILQQ